MNYLERLKAVAALRTSARQPKDHKVTPIKATEAKILDKPSTKE